MVKTGISKCVVASWLRVSRGALREAFLADDHRIPVISAYLMAVSGTSELAAMCALRGKIQSKEEYMQYIQVVSAKAAYIYRYMKNFDQTAAFVEVAETVWMLPV